ncbi:MAG: guanylate kinase [Candidatus Improbicoccus devescovinae]|nr:MAG: guanylate kinase [Candidatus Improbicoccus devescovinae]
MILFKKGSLIVFSGPSGVGKDAVLARMKQKYSNLYISVSATTRKPREYEKNGVDYYFLSNDQFIQIEQNNGFLENVTYCGNKYGTILSEITEKIDEGKDVILKIEVTGGLEIIKKFPDCLSVYILPPSVEVLRQRLIKRASEDLKVIEQRLKLAEEEIKCSCFYDFEIVNDNIETCANLIVDIIRKK